MRWWSRIGMILESEFTRWSWKTQAETLASAETWLHKSGAHLGSYIQLIVGPEVRFENGRMTRNEADELKGHIIWALLMKELGSYSEVRKLLKASGAFLLLLTLHSSCIVTCELEQRHRGTSEEAVAVVQVSLGRVWTRTDSGTEWRGHTAELHTEAGRADGGFLSDESQRASLTEHVVCWESQQKSEEEMTLHCARGWNTQ